jgi:hypothetical protein
VVSVVDVEAIAVDAVVSGAAVAVIVVETAVDSVVAVVAIAVETVGSFQFDLKSIQRGLALCGPFFL